MFLYSCRIESLPGFGRNWIQHPNGVVKSYNLNQNVMGLSCMYCLAPCFLKYGVMDSSLLTCWVGWYLKMHCPLIALNNSHIFSNLSEELWALFSSRWKYRFYFRHSVFVIIADATKLWQSSCLFYYICCLDCPAYPLTKRIMRKAFRFSTVMVKLVDLMHVLFISVFV